MNMIKNAFLVSTFFLGACSTTTYYNGEVIPGTDSLVVQVPYFANRDKGRIEVTKNRVIVKRGQRLVFVGPDNFAIRLNDDMDVFEKDYVESSDGVIILPIPQEGNTSGRQKQNLSNEITVKYDVVVGDDELDPFIIIKGNH